MYLITLIVEPIIVVHNFISIISIVNMDNISRKCIRIRLNPELVIKGGRGITSRQKPEFPQPHSKSERISKSDWQTPTTS